jgi:ABC-type bacteriocin/lantibiotic exporter with double-glycine peptidase domain
MASVIGTLAVIAFGAPVVLLMVIPLGFAYRVIMRYYLATSRELKRLDAVSRSPVFAWFSETLSGVSTIRAYGQQERFIANNEARLDRNMACYMPAQSVNRWLAVRRMVKQLPNFRKLILSCSSGPIRVPGVVSDVRCCLDFGCGHARFEEARCRASWLDDELRYICHR